MIDISLGGLIGAVIGTIVAALLYGVFAGLAQRAALKYRPQGQERSVWQQELALLRRGVLTLDILIFAGAGYWLGHRLGG